MKRFTSHAGGIESLTIQPTTDDDGVLIEIQSFTGTGQYWAGPEQVVDLILALAGYLPQLMRAWVSES